MARRGRKEGDTDFALSYAAVGRIIGTSGTYVDLTEHIAIRKLWRMGLPSEGNARRRNIQDAAMLQVALREMA